MNLLPRPQGRKDDILEGAVLLHGILELVEGDLAVAVRVHLVEHLVQLPRLCDVTWKAVLGQGLPSEQQQFNFVNFLTET